MQAPSKTSPYVPLDDVCKMDLKRCDSGCGAVKSPTLTDKLFALWTTLDLGFHQLTGI